MEANLSITEVLADFLVIAYFVVERLLRKGERARSLQADQQDRGSSYLLLSVGFVNILIIFLAPIFNQYGLGNWEQAYISWIGVLLMSCGLTIRYFAAQTLGQFYTRTLQIFESHQIVEQGLYQIIRHPGYLGLSAMEVGAGLAVKNWAILLFVSLTGLMSRLYRIHSEETMLSAHFGEQYQTYSDKTWRLIPFIY